MPQLILNDSYLTGIASVDEEHRRMIDRFNELVQRVSADAGSEAVDEALLALIDETRDHFLNEERLLEAHGYDGLAAHRLEHDDLLTQVEQYELRYRAGTLKLNEHVMALLKDWLVEHILHADRAYADHLLGAQGGGPTT